MPKLGGIVPTRRLLYSSRLTICEFTDVIEGIDLVSYLLVVVKVQKLHDEESRQNLPDVWLK